MSQKKSVQQTKVKAQKFRRCAGRTQVAAFALLKSTNKSSGYFFFPFNKVAAFLADLC